MKKIVVGMLICLIFSAFLVGCGSQQAEPAQMSKPVMVANPWSDWDCLEEAETAVGFSFGVPEVVADRFSAAAFRTLNGELIEVIYCYEDFEIRVRKQEGEGQDISGDYNTYDSHTEKDVSGGTVTTYHNSGSGAVKQIISRAGYSWSLTAPDGFSEEADADFLNHILKD